MPDYNIPMGMPAAQVDGRIPLAADARLPLAVENFKPIDPAQNAMTAYKLADAAGNLQDKTAERQDAQVVRQEKLKDKMILEQFLASGGDLYTPEGIDKAAKELKGRVSLDSYQNLGKLYDQKLQAKAKLQETLSAMSESDLKVATTQQEEILRLLTGPKNAYDTTLKETKDPAKATQAFNAAKAATIQMAGQLKGASGQPLYPPDKLKQFEEVTPDALAGQIAQTKWALDLAEKQASIKLKGAQTNAANSLSDQRSQGKELTSIKAIDDAVAAGEISSTDGEALKKKLTTVSAGRSVVGVPEDQVKPEERSLAVNQWIQNPSSLRGMDPTYQRNVVKWAADLGVTAEDVMAGRARQKFDLASAGSSGRRAGQMASVEETIPGLIKNALEMSAKVPRASWVPFNKLAQIAETSISDPNLRAFKIANQAVSSEYQQVIARGGSNVTALTEAMHLLQTADSQEAYEAALRQVEKEVKINVEGSEKVRARFTPKHGPGAEVVSPGRQAAADTDRPAILSGELRAAQERLAKATDEDGKKRAQQDIVSIQREMKAAGIPVTDAKQSGAAAPTPTTVPAAPADIKNLLLKYGRNNG